MDASVQPEERQLAGMLNGILYQVGGGTLAIVAVLPGSDHRHRTLLLVLAALACIAGLSSIVLIDWRRAHGWVIHAFTTGMLLMVALTVASSGGATSPAWIYLFFTALFTAYFYPRAVATAYLLGCVLVHALPLLYDPQATEGLFISQFVIAAPAYVVLGEAISGGKRRMLELRERAEALAAEQGALRRVATAVVSGDLPERIYELVALELAGLLHAGAAGILRLNPSGDLTVVGSHAQPGGVRYLPGTIVPTRPGSDVERAIQTVKPIRIDDHAPDSPVGLMGYQSSIVAPILVGGKPWGILAVAAAGRPFGEQDEQSMHQLSALLSTAIAHVEDRAKLAAQAATDALTGLANRRTLEQRLAAETARAVRHETPLSVAVIDIDNFKQINDTAGHKTGDEMIVRLARALRSLARTEDTLGRLGGDEFAWVLPETTREQALVAVERARTLIAAATPDPYRITVSAGICDTRSSGDPVELIRLADAALYFSKAHGRNQCWIYDPAVVSDLSDQERAERLERSQALIGMRALVRSLDARDAATRNHAERVATFAVKLASAAGWSRERATELGEAAFFHDIGKVAAPAAELADDGPPNAELGARILDGILSPEQLEWIAAQEERPDGSGYPHGLTEDSIPEGAALIALADAWDQMTGVRPGTVSASLLECWRQMGTRFTDSALTALAALDAAGELTAQTTRARLEPR